MIPANAAPLAIALLGLLLGMRHATDPDHVIAVTTILSREHRLAAATRIGVVWGLGHTLTVLIVGAAIIFFKIAIPARLGLAMEFAVAVVLILLGVGAAASLVRKGATRMRGASRQPDELLVHAHAHTHDGATHVHPHVHVGDHENNNDATHRDHRIPADVLPSFAARSPLLRSFAVGLVHGLAGSAAIALLVLSAIPSIRYGRRSTWRFSASALLSGWDSSRPPSRHHSWWCRDARHGFVKAWSQAQAC